MNESNTSNTDQAAPASAQQPVEQASASPAAEAAQGPERAQDQHRPQVEEPAAEAGASPPPEAAPAEAAAQAPEAAAPEPAAPEAAAPEAQTPSPQPAAESAADEPPQPPAEEEQVHYELVRGRVREVGQDRVIVEVPDYHGRTRGAVPLEQFSRPPRVGSVMDFVVEGDDPDAQMLNLACEGAAAERTWRALHPGSIVEAKVLATNKGGLEMEISGGITAFMPTSQIDLRHVGDVRRFVGQKLEGVVQEIDRDARKVVVSRRKFLEQQRDKVWSQLQVGQLHEGRIRGITQFGAFVDLGGVDGLIHISDLSHGHIEKVGDVVKIGQRLQVKVLSLDKDKDKIRLGLKQVQPNPWKQLADQFQPGQQVKGKVVRVAGFGAFIEVAPGIEGLLPVSEMSWGRIDKPEAVAKVGDELEVAVLEVDRRKRRLSLSLKALQPDPWEGAADKYAKGEWFEGAVLRTTDFGAFVELEPGIEGLAHISELADHHVKQVDEVVQAGQTHRFRVIETDTKRRRIRLTMRTQDRPTAAARDDRRPPRRKPSRPLKGGLE